VQRKRDPLISVFHRNGMWCIVKEAEHSFLAGALPISNDAPPKAAVEAAHVMFPGFPQAAIVVREPQPDLFIP
jgi:hypothetical protein